MGCKIPRSRSTTSAIWASIAVAAAHRPPPRCRDARPLGLIRQIPPIFATHSSNPEKNTASRSSSNARRMSLGPLRQQKSAASRNLKALVRKLIVVGVRQWLPLL